MRTALILFLAGALGCVFLVQKHREHKAEAALAAAPAHSTTPRPVSEHNWAKRALDTTAKGDPTRSRKSGRKTETDK